MRAVPNCTQRRGIALAVLAAVLLACCAETVNGSGHASSPSATTPSVDFPTPTASSATPTLPPSTVTAPPSPTPTQGADISGVKYTVPTGWERSTGYVEVLPLEASYQAKYLIPSGVPPGLDVISIVLYRLPAEHLVDTRTEQVVRIHSYNAKRSVIIKRGLKDTVVGGLPAFDESVIQPGGSEGEFRYAAWFIFGGAHVVQISCQVSSHVDAVATGCQKLLDSVTFG